MEAPGGTPCPCRRPWDREGLGKLGFACLRQGLSRGKSLSSKHTALGFEIPAGGICPATPPLGPAPSVRQAHTTTPALKGCQESRIEVAIQNQGRDPTKGEFTIYCSPPTEAVGSRAHPHCRLCWERPHEQPRPDSGQPQGTSWRQSGQDLWSTSQFTHHTDLQQALHLRLTVIGPRPYEEMTMDPIFSSRKLRHGAIV